MPELTTSRLVLRRPKPSDYSAAREFYLSERSKYAGGGIGTTDSKAFVIFAAMLGHWEIRGFGTYVALRNDTGSLVGGFGPHFPDGRPERELGWCIWDPAQEGLGFAFEATLALRNFVYGDLNWKTVVSYIHPDNAHSVRLAEKLGCSLDPDAEVPPAKDPPPLVYRHPDP
ncbi:MAG: GNAT family N-acetyltransferase [Silicimonas sp.]|nr:GNAT family N-acetyltransferase [Silicimonas sp.]